MIAARLCMAGIDIGSLESYGCVTSGHKTKGAQEGEAGAGRTLGYLSLYSTTMVLSLLGHPASESQPLRRCASREREHLHQLKGGRPRGHPPPLCPQETTTQAKRLSCTPRPGARRLHRCMRGRRSTRTSRCRRATAARSYSCPRALPPPRANPRRGTLRLRLSQEAVSHHVFYDVVSLVRHATDRRPRSWRNRLGTRKRRDGREADPHAARGSRAMQYRPHGDHSCFSWYGCLPMVGAVRPRVWVLSSGAAVVWKHDPQAPKQDACLARR